jgi:stage III sporulation protein AB
MFRLLGAMLIIFSSGLAGLRVASAFSCRARQLRILQEALQLLDTEIMYATTPLPMALRRVAAAVGGALGDIFLEAAGLLGAGHGYTPGEAWSLALGRGLRHTALAPEDRAILQAFGEALGSSDRAEQHKHITLAAYHLRQEEEKAEGDRRKNERIWRYGGFLVGIGIVLILL